MYDPYVDRYWQSDPIGLAGGLNTYAYAGSNPLAHIDPLGLYYSSLEEAAYAALCAIYPLSYAHNKEWIGLLVTVGPGEYDYEPPVESNSKDNSSITMSVSTQTVPHKFLGIFPWTEVIQTPANGVVGWYHSHGQPGEGDESYSLQDASTESQYVNFPGWYVDWHGVVRRGGRHSGKGKPVSGKCPCAK